MKVVILAVRFEKDVEPEDFSNALKHLRKKYAERLETDDIILKVV